MTTAEAISLMTAIAGLILAFIAWRKVRPEKNKLDAETLESLQKTLGDAVDLNEKLQIRIAGVEQRTVILLAESKKKDKRMEEIERVNSGLDKVNRQVIAENRRLEKYVKDLIAEIVRCGGDVPPMPELVIEDDSKTTVDRED